MKIGLVHCEWTGYFKPQVTWTDRRTMPSYSCSTATITLSRTVCKINRYFSRKLQTSSTLMYLTPLAERVPLGIWYRRLGSKN